MSLRARGAQVSLRQCTGSLPLQQSLPTHKRTHHIPSRYGNGHLLDCAREDKLGLGIGVSGEVHDSGLVRAVVRDVARFVARVATTRCIAEFWVVLA